MRRTSLAAVFALMLALLGSSAPALAQDVTPTPQMAPIRDPKVDPGGTLSDAFMISLDLPPAVSGVSGDTSVDLDSVMKLPAGVQLADFYAELHFPTPSVPANTAYFVGFCFWVDPAGNCYDIYLEDDGTGASTWGYGYDPTSGDYQSLGRGALPASSVDPTPGADNFLALTVYQGVAILSGNTFSAAAVIPMQAPAVIGDVKAEVGFVSTSAGITAAPLPMSLSNFAVWDLSSGMAPVQGEPTPQPTLIPATAALPTTAPVPTTAAAIPTTTPVTANAPVFPPVQASSGVLGGVFQHARGVATALPPIASAMSGAFIQLQDQYNWAPASASLADFYTIVTFVNPADLSTPSDIGIGFRASQEPETGWRFVLQSSGQWYLMQPGQQATASGTAASFVATPGASNTIELLAQGGTGLIAVNGLVLGSLDLTAVPAAGDIYVGSGFFQGDTVPGRQVAYQDWWIYPMSILDVKSG